MKTFKHKGGPGDAIYGLAIMKELGGGILHVNFDSDKRFDQRLFERQDYIKKLVYHVKGEKEWERFEVDYNLDLFRLQPFNSGYTLVECHAMAHNLKMDFTKQWLFNVKPKTIAEISVTDTGKLRWPGVTIDWEQLRGYEKKCVFIGLPHEYDNFIRDRDLNIEFYKIKDAYEWARIIKGSKLFVGNQSSGLSIAEGLKSPRVADLFEGKSKQYPHGDNGHYEISKKLIKSYLL